MEDRGEQLAPTSNKSKYQLKRKRSEASSVAAADLSEQAPYQPKIQLDGVNLIIEKADIGMME